MYKFSEKIKFKHKSIGLKLIPFCMSKLYKLENLRSAYELAGTVRSGEYGKVLRKLCCL